MIFTILQVNVVRLWRRFLYFAFFVPLHSAKLATGDNFSARRHDRFFPYSPRTLHWFVDKIGDWPLQLSTGCSLSSAIESKRPWKEGSGKGFCHYLWASQRYKNVVTAKEMFHCQLLVWSQLAVSEGFGGITYCLADSNFGVSHGSVSQVKTACIQRSTIDKHFLSFFARAALHAYYIFIPRDINNSAIWLALPTFRQSTRKVCVIHQTSFQQLRAPPKYARAAKH